jgi:hypothetical protein
MRMKVTVLDPTAAPPVSDVDPGPDAGPLAGKRVGLRLDTAWRSWLWVADEWAQRLEAAGATVDRWEAGNRVGDARLTTRAGLDAFADRIDVALVGLGN